MKRVHSLIATGLCCLAIAESRADDVREDFLKLIDRSRVPLAATVESTNTANGITQLRFSFAAEAGQRVPGILLRPEDAHGLLPVVIALHGTGGNKQSMLSVCRKLVAAGFIAVAIDGRYHGERSKTGRGSADYDEAIIRAWHEGREHPLYYDTVWDVMRAVDYLQTREDVDAKRIGLIGISKGGIETYFAAAADPRIAVAVPCIGAQSFRWELDNDDWRGRIGTVQKAFDAIAKAEDVTAPDAAFVRKFYDRIVPGIYGEFDGPAMLALIAPRPLLVINGDSDPHTPLASLVECTTAARQAYRAASAEDRFDVSIQEKTGHQVRPDAERAAIDWFVKWLKP